MSSAHSYPKVVIVGRTNVGKSALFNRLSDRQKSIVFDGEGVTRDYIHEVIEWDGRMLDLIDSGGIAFAKSDDLFSGYIQEQVQELVRGADVVLLVCDLKAGVTRQDQKIAKWLHTFKKQVLVLLNKAESETMRDENTHEFYSLGFKHMRHVSALHGRGIGDILREVVALVPQKSGGDEPAACKVSLLGKPNVGKSSLMNVLLSKKRSIVSDVPGTTRESITETVFFHKESLSLTDTAGVRRKRSVNESLEELMVKSSMQAVRSSDVILFMLDATAHAISKQELKLLSYAIEQKKCVVLLINKSDAVDDASRKLFLHDLKRHCAMVDMLPVLWVSCTLKRNVGKILETVTRLRARCLQEFAPEKLDEIVARDVVPKPLYKNGIQLIVKKLRAVPAKVPTFRLSVNHTQLFSEGHITFIENVLRKNYDLNGCPVRVILK